jgi:hypothetical protein
LKVFYTNSSAEYHRGDASLAHTNAEGTRDVPSGPSARVYHFAGTEHGLGVWPPTSEKIAAADPSEPSENSQNLRNTIDYAPLLRACLVNMDRWVTESSRRRAVIASRRRRVPRGAPRCSIASPAPYPRHARPARLLRAPPRPGPACGSSSAVDADGNGPAASAAGDGRSGASTARGQRLVFAGATIPFARTRREREASGDRARRGALPLARRPSRARPPRRPSSRSAMRTSIRPPGRGARVGSPDRLSRRV